MKNTCIVIPTHERQTYLKRCIAYYKNFSCKVIICDSSVTAYTEVCPPNICYYHLPGTKFSAKILFALNIVNEDFVALAADDDFLFEGALIKGTEILRNNSAIQACVGDVLTFPDTLPFRVIGRYAGSNANSISSSAEKNISNYLSNYHQVLWSLFRHETLKLCFEIIDLANFENENFFELTISAICAGKGGINYIDEYWILREMTQNEHWGSRHLPITRANLVMINNDVRKYHYAINNALFFGAADLALSSYISMQDQSSRIHIRIGRVFNRFVQKSKKLLQLDSKAINWENDFRFAPILKIINFSF